jgi:hypothetical protein
VVLPAPFGPISPVIVFGADFKVDAVDSRAGCRKP